MELERERLQRQKRLEDAAIAVYLAVDKRAAASVLGAKAEHEMAAGLRSILAEGADVERAATLCDLTLTEVRRLTRAGPNGRSTAGAPHSGPAAMGSVDRGSSADDQTAK